MRTTALSLAALSFLFFVSSSAQAITPGISVEIADIVQFPDTRGMGTEDGRVSTEVARLNFMRELPDSSNRWWVNDLRGQIYVVDSQTQQIQPDLYLDFNTEFSRFTIGPGGLSTGLITVTPHPDFATNGKFYTTHVESIGSRDPDPDFVPSNYSGSMPFQNVIMEWTATDPSANVFSGTSRELMRIGVPSGGNPLHPMGGDILFNPADGLMYISGGDHGFDSEGRGGGNASSRVQAQDLTSILGKILRIDPSGTVGTPSANGAYSIPTDNPFYDGAGSNLDEVFAMGFRNAHRIIQDPVTGVLLATDIGQSFAEEVNVIEAGFNYGFGPNNAQGVGYEGTFLRNGGGIGRVPSGFRWPGAEYLHSELPANFDAIAGGFVYRGSMIPELYGKFVYGDIISGLLLYSDFDDIVSFGTDDGSLDTAEVFSLSLTQNGSPILLEDLIIDARGQGETTLPNSNRHDLRFGQTSDGEIYIITKQDGFIRQLVGVPEPATLALGVLTLAGCGLSGRRLRRRS